MAEFTLYDGQTIDLPGDLLGGHDHIPENVQPKTLEAYAQIFGADSWQPVVVEGGRIAAYQFLSNGNVVNTLTFPPGFYVAQVTIDGQVVHQAVDPNDNYLYFVDRAGHGQPVHKEEPGQTLYTDGRGYLVVDETSLHVAKFATVSILDRIFRLLTKMLESMQRVAANQAQRLTFLTAWQRAYTDVMNQIQPFVGFTGTGAIGGIHNPGGESTSQPSIDRRQSMNDKNSNWTETLRGNRQLIADDAKALQSLVNQTNDAVSQQANMATSILQQFSTILGAIYR